MKQEINLKIVLNGTLVPPPAPARDDNGKLLVSTGVHTTTYSTNSYAFKPKGGKAQKLTVETCVMECTLNEARYYEENRSNQTMEAPCNDQYVIACD